MTDARAIDLLHRLVAIPSVSRDEARAAHWLVDQMRGLGYERAFVDEAGNAVGEIGRPDCGTTVILLGHIDTVPGNIPVRIESVDGVDVLFGRGSVDAKGPLATFVAAGARLGTTWSRDTGVRLVVVGAVEEEAATSKGARAIAARFDGASEPVPIACVIGEPSRWHRFTIGYKGRLLMDIDARQPMSHTAGPDASVASAVVEIWNSIAAQARAFNTDHERVFDQLSPSLRRFVTATTPEMDETVDAQIAWRLPMDFDAERFVTALLSDVARILEGTAPAGDGRDALRSATVRIQGATTNVALVFSGWERAWRGDRQNALARSFLSAIRRIDSSTPPGVLVKTGTSDMNVVAPVWGCPVVAYGPGDSALDHTPREHLAIAEYLTAIAVLEAALRTLVTSD